MQLEWERIWTKVWLLGGLESDMPEPGDYISTEIGRESVLLVRQERRHRARRSTTSACIAATACAPTGIGSADSFKCQYHHWEYDIDGAFKRIPDLETFPQGAPPCRGLVEVRCDTWGGFVWFSLNPDVDPLRDFLDPMPLHLDPYNFPKMALTRDITVEWDCNWKTSVDAFNESYHVQGIHPQLMWYLHDLDIQIDCYERHNRYLIPFATWSPRVRRPPSIPDPIKVIMKTAGMDPADYDEPLENLRRDVQQLKRKHGPAQGKDYSRLNDDQLTDDYHYLIFPNVTLNVHADDLMLFRQRPHPTDPDRMFYDIWTFELVPDGQGAAGAATSPAFSSMARSRSASCSTRTPRTCPACRPACIPPPSRDCGSVRRNCASAISTRSSTTTSTALAANRPAPPEREAIHERPYFSEASTHDSTTQQGAVAARLPADEDDPRVRGATARRDRNRRDPGLHAPVRGPGSRRGRRLRAPRRCRLHREHAPRPRPLHREGLRRQGHDARDLRSRDGLCKGKGGSMHIADVTKGMLGANAIVGGGPPLAVGAAIACRNRGNNNVSIAFGGDGSCNQGTVFEAMNMAVVLKVPAIFVFENNGYSEHTGKDYAVGSKDIAGRARGFGMPAEKCDGADFFSVYEAAGRLIERARDAAKARRRSRRRSRASTAISRATRSSIAPRTK